MTFQKRKLELSIATIIASCALLAACGGGATTASTDSISDPRAAVGPDRLEENDSPLYPQSIAVMGSDGGFIGTQAKSGGVAIAAAGANADATLIFADSHSKQDLASAKAALASGGRVIVDSSASEAGRTAVAKTIGELLDLKGPYAELDGAVLSKHGVDAVMVTPIDSPAAIAQQKASKAAKVAAKATDGESTQAEEAADPDNSAGNVLGFASRN